MIKSLFRIVMDEIRLKKDAAAYFRSIGVQVGKGTLFYGPTRSMFSSEPYLVKIGENCHITSGVTFIPHDGSPLIFRSRHPKIDIVAPIVVGDRVFIGSRAILLAGVTIGDDCVIGAGSVVTKDVPSGTVWAGVPARFIKTLEEYERTAVVKSVETKGLPEEEKRRVLTELYRTRLQPQEGTE